MFDVTVCQFDAPIILSWPHFLGAEERFSSGVTGLHPDKVSCQLLPVLLHWCIVVSCYQTVTTSLYTYTGL